MAEQEDDTSRLLAKRERSRAYYHKNRERLLEKKKEYHAQNREERAAYNKAYYDKNQEVLVQYAREYRASGGTGHSSRRDKYAEDAQYREKLKEAARSWRAAHTEHRDTVRARRTANPAAEMWRTAKIRASKQGVAFDLDVSDVVVPSHCPILGIPLQVQTGKVGRNSPSLDRIYPDRGYTKGNVQVVSYKANTMKNNATPEDLLRFSHWATTSFGLFGTQQELDLARSTGDGI